MSDAQTARQAEHCTPIAVCDFSPLRLLVQMLETGPADLSFRVLLREFSRRRDEALEEARERTAGLLAIGLVLAIPLFGIASGSVFPLVDGSKAAEPIAGFATVEPPRVNAEAVLTRLRTDALTPSEIRTIQTLLHLRGFDPGPIDGVAGERTLSALNAYRRSIQRPAALAVSRETIRVLQDQ